MSNIETITVGGTQYNIGGGGGLLPHIVITSESENTITVTTPSGSIITPTSTSSGVWECDVDEYGIYTVDATYDGHDAEETVTVDMVKVYAVEIHIVTIPDGSTVTPTDDIPTWLACAGIDNYKNLIKNSATSQTINGVTFTVNADGSVTANGTATELAVFDVVNTQLYSWRPRFDAGSYKLSCEGVVTGTSYFALTVIKGGTVYYDYLRVPEGTSEVTWTDADISDITDYFFGIVIQNGQTVNNVTFYPMFRLASIADDTYEPYRHYTTLSEVLSDTDTYTTLLGDSNACDYMARSTTWASTIVADADAMRLLGMYDYACDALLSDSTWASAIANSTYFESVLNVKVPKMTSNTAPSGEASASSSGSNYAPYKAFDGNTSTFWLAQSTGAGWLQYEFASAIRLAKVSLYIAKSSTNTSEYLESITGANDGAETTIFDTRTLINSSSQATTTILPITHSGSYTKIRLNLSIPNTVQCYADEVQFYGRKPVQTDIIHSAPSDTIYYMDNGSPVTLCTTDTDGIGSVDWSTLPTGDITLYSSIAKNPTDLTADYSKTIKVTKNKVEGYLMPDTALYWYGYKDALLQDVSTANGWSRSGSWTGTTAPTYQTNYVSLKGSSSTTYSGIGSATSISLSGLTLVINPIALSSASRNGLVSAETTKTLPSGTYPTDSNHAWATTTGIQKLALSPTENNYYPACISATNSQCDLYAMWYE